jgi:hypothetical protein
MNIAVCRGRFFAIPQQLGDVAGLDLSQPDALPSGVMMADTIEALIKELEYVARWANARGNFEAQEAQPIFRAGTALGEPEISVLDSGFAIVKGDGEFYAVRIETINDLTKTVRLRGAGPSGVSVESAFSIGAGIAVLGAINDYFAFAADNGYFAVHQMIFRRANATNSLNGVPLYEYPGILKAKTYPELLRMVGWRRDRSLPPGVRDGADAGNARPHSAPRVVRSLHGYNVIAYEGWFYGIPEALGQVDLTEVDALSLPGVVADVAQVAVEQVIQAKAMAAARQESNAL